MLANRLVGTPGVFRSNNLTELPGLNTTRRDLRHACEKGGAIRRVIDMLDKARHFSLSPLMMTQRRSLQSALQCYIIQVVLYSILKQRRKLGQFENVSGN